MKTKNTRTHEKNKSLSNHEYLTTVKDTLLWTEEKALKSKHRQNFGGWLQWLQQLCIQMILFNLIINCAICLPFINLLDLFSSRNYQNNEDHIKTNYIRYKIQARVKPLQREKPKNAPLLLQNILTKESSKTPIPKPTNPPCPKPTPC